TSWALCGLGHIPEDDLHQLRQRPVVYLALDGDEAGLKNQAKLAQELGPLTMLVDPFEGYKDANEYLQHNGDPQFVAAMLQASTPVLDLRIQQTKTATPHELQRLTGEILEMLTQLPKELEPRYLQKTQRALGMSRKELRALMSAEQEQGDIAPILSDVKDGRLTFLGEPLGNFSAHITHEMTVDDGMNLPEVQYTLRGKLAAGPPLPEVTINADEFAEMKWIARYWGARPIPFLPKGKYYLLSRAIQEISLTDMQQERVYTFTGWTDVEGVRSYLSASGCITAEGFNDSVRVNLGKNNRQHYSLPKPPDANSKELANAVRASLDFLKLGTLSVTAPIWAAMFAGPLTEIFPLYGVIWFYGATQSGKSTIAHLALTHFGAGFIRGRQYNAPQDWISTITAMEQVMFDVKDAPVILDDFAPQFADAGSARRMHRMAHTIVRSVGNRSARGRSTRDLKECKTRIPRGLVIVTAELPLSGESTVGRMLYVPINRGDVLPDPASGETSRPEVDKAQAQAEAGLYAQAMATYIQWLASNWERATQLFKEIMDKSSNLARKRGKLQNRLPDYFALLDAAQQVALIAFQEMGVLSAQEAGAIMYDNSEAILGVIENQAERIAAESPVRKFFEALDNLLERRKVYLAPKTIDPNMPYEPPPQAELVGYFDAKDEQVIYLNDGACLAHIRAYWAALGENFDTTTDALRRQFNQVSGLLHKREGNNLTVSVWAGSKTRRVLAISAERVMSLYGVTLKNENDPSPIISGKNYKMEEK
ncbi:MAG: DUF927 domain-containing protein, partial [Chloroflexi bacterium]|nr:DUF927 domain-containing protein [Chloroflexota bacterium]